MSNNVVGVKISEFNVASSIDSSAFIPFISNGTNLTVSYETLRQSFGAIGTIKGVGGGTSVPILDKPSSSINYIRGVLGQQGVTTTLAPTGEVLIKSNFANAAGGNAQLISDPTAAQIKLKSLIAGDGITLEQNDNSVTVSYNIATDIRPIALLSLSSEATTTISAANTPVQVNGTFTDEQSSLFTVSTAGLVTYLGVRALNADVTATITFTGASGTDNLTFYVAKNGAIITSSGVTKDVTSAGNESISLVWNLTLEQNDTVSIFVENNDSTTDVSVSKLIARIK